MYILKDAKAGNPGKILCTKAYIKLKITGEYTDIDGMPYLYTTKDLVGKTTLALSVGGDNYCYSNQKSYALVNKEYKNSGIKTVYKGGPIEPEIVKNKNISKDLKSYKLIVARKSITYKAVKKIGANVVLALNPVFFIQAEICEVDHCFNDGNAIGINISSIIVFYEKQMGVACANYMHLSDDYILSNTNMKIAFITRVVWKRNDDRSVLQRLFDNFEHDRRLMMIEDYKAQVLKYMISRCIIFVEVRIYSIVAAYLMMAPTLVVGYSIKARGNAADLLSEADEYVLLVQNFGNDGEEFCRIMKNGNNIKNYFNRFISDYIIGGKLIKKILESV